MLVRACPGIIMGMTLLGVIGDTIGRKWGSVTTASIMLLGAAMLTATNGVTAKGFTIMYLISQMVFGCGPCCHAIPLELLHAGSPSLCRQGREHSAACAPVLGLPEATPLCRRDRGHCAACTPVLGNAEPLLL
jgi:hypothetical protein